MDQNVFNPLSLNECIYRCYLLSRFFKNIFVRYGYENNVNLPTYTEPKLIPLHKIFYFVVNLLKSILVDKDAAVVRKFSDSVATIKKN